MLSLIRISVELVCVQIHWGICTRGIIGVFYILHVLFFEPLFDMFT